MMSSRQTNGPIFVKRSCYENAASVVNKPWQKVVNCIDSIMIQLQRHLIQVNSDKSVL